MARKKKAKKSVTTISHSGAKRRNIPTAEHQSVMDEEQQQPVNVRYERDGSNGLKEESDNRNPDLDPQLIWKGKSGEPLDIPAPPLFIQEKVHPKVLIDDLLKRTEDDEARNESQVDLFADFNGVDSESAKTEFYQHDANWQNRMILGDSLRVMASLAEREGLRGKVQCIYIDPPYGIKFNSNFQWSTTSRDVKDGKQEHITRDPEMVKAFRDTWRDGIHSYLSYLRDRLTVARDLLSESGSIFVQIGDENVHRVRAVMDEVFQSENCLGEIAFVKTSGLSSNFLARRFDYLLWYAKSAESAKFRRPYLPKTREEGTASTYSWIRDRRADYRGMTSTEKSTGAVPEGYFVYKPDNITSQGNPLVDFEYEGRSFRFRSKTTVQGLTRLERASRIHRAKNSVQYVRRLDDFGVLEVSQLWADTGTGSFTTDKVYVVQTGTKAVQRCILMATDPGDLVLDPTCGSGTTAAVAEQWGRRWITIDTSRVALALARARIMGAKYPWYVLADSPEGQKQIAEITSKPPADILTSGNVRNGFVNTRIPHITLGDIANNAEIDVLWEKHEEEMKPLREKLTEVVGQVWIEALREESKPDIKLSSVIQEWEVPRDFPEDWPSEAEPLHEEFWKLRIQRQQEIDESIARNAEFEYLYDQPYEDKSTVRVAGPFTVESMMPHRVLGLDENDELIDTLAEGNPEFNEAQSFVPMILENLKTAGVQQAHKEDKIDFTSLAPWPGDMICAEGRYIEGDKETVPEKRAAIFIGPEFGTASRPDLVAAAREAGDAGFDVLITCAFNYDAHSSEFDKLGRIPVLKARMNADLHMADDLKNTGQGNLFVIFGEPDIDILDAKDDQIQVKINGVDVFHPNTGTVQSDNADGIACWFIDTDYNEESFFVRHAYFLGSDDPYKSLKTTLKAEINPDAWATLNSDTSRPFDKPETGRIAVKVINHLGDEVMKVFKVS